MQGVWFRASLQQEAQRLGINGFVRNDPDGSVYTEMEGDEFILKRLVDWCWKGPEMARVQHVFVEEGPIVDYAKFEIKN